VGIIAVQGRQRAGGGPGQVARRGAGGARVGAQRQDRRPVPAAGPPRCGRKARFGRDGHPARDAGKRLSSAASAGGAQTDEAAAAGTVGGSGRPGWARGARPPGRGPRRAPPGHRVARSLEARGSRRPPPGDEHDSRPLTARRVLESLSSGVFGSGGRLLRRGWRGRRRVRRLLLQPGRGRPPPPRQEARERRG
jgi:hypothetical protein